MLQFVKLFSRRKKNSAKFVQKPQFAKLIVLSKIASKAQSRGAEEERAIRFAGKKQRELALLRYWFFTPESL